MKNDRCPPTKSAGGHSFDNFDGIMWQRVVTRLAEGVTFIGRLQVFY